MGSFHERKEKCIHVSTLSSPRPYSFPLQRFYSLPLRQFSYSRLFADGKVSNPTRRRRKMYAKHSATIWLTRLCCFFGEKKENDPWQKRKGVQTEEKFQLLASQFNIREEDWLDEQGNHSIKLLSQVSANATGLAIVAHADVKTLLEKRTTSLSPDPLAPFLCHICWLCQYLFVFRWHCGQM